MDGQLKPGTLLTGDSGSSYKVIRLLGAGGQGEVYDVECNGSHYALKWYFPQSADQMQKDILDNLITSGTPSPSFLWPQDLIFNKIGSFGYIMPLRPKRFKSIVDLMKGRINPTFYALCRAAYNMTYGYQLLHARGYSYRDISFGNIFFDPDNGEVLICDNDNVAPSDPNAHCTILGTPGFMAPEIVSGNARPSRETDLHSLAVLLFYTFMLGHPLDGKHEYDIKCMDENARRYLYGTNPIFIFDPADKSNRPVRGWHDTVITYWNLYPQSLKNLFTEAFTTGLHQPNRRVTENVWLKVFSNLMCGIVSCSHCSADNFYDEQKVAAHIHHTCWNCGRTIQLPYVLAVGKNRIALVKNARIYAHHINGHYDMETVVGAVVQNPNNPSIWGIKNMGKSNWTYKKPDGTQLQVESGRSATIAKDVKIDFGEAVGEIQVGS